jgi:septum formation protein
MTPKLIIGTKSEARLELLRSIGLKFISVEANVKEDILEDPIETIKSNTYKKYRYLLGEGYHGIICTFDTIVYKDGSIIGKPNSAEDAFKILRELSGGSHYVYTGIGVGNGEIWVFDYESTEVYMDNLGDDIINWYIGKDEYVGAAGGYRIQGYASLFIVKIVGDYYNVVGIPIHKFFELLEGFGIKYHEIL